MRSFLHWIQNHMYLVDIIKLTHYEFAQKTFYENPTSVFGRLITCTAFTRCEAPPLTKSYSRRRCYTKLAVLANPDPDVLLSTEFL